MNPLNIWPGRRKKPFAFENLPPELMDMIFKCLSMADRICLALINKHSYTHLESLTGSACPLKLPKRDPSSILECRLERWARKRLLSRLKLNRWRRCDACASLHPRLKRKNRYKAPCAIFRQIFKPASQTRCPRVAVRVIDILPCFSLPVKDINRLVKFICSSRRASHVDDQRMPEWTLRNDPAHPTTSIEHICEYQIYGIKNKIRTSIYARLLIDGYHCDFLEVKSFYSCSSPIQHAIELRRKKTRNLIKFLKGCLMPDMMIAFEGWSKRELTPAQAIRRPGNPSTDIVIWRTLESH